MGLEQHTNNGRRAFGENSKLKHNLIYNRYLQKAFWHGHDSKMHNQQTKVGVTIQVPLIMSDDACGLDQEGERRSKQKI